MINSVFIKHNSTYKRILFDDIQYIKAIGDYIEIWTSNKRYVVNGGIADFHKKLHPGKFIQIHRSYVINSEKITEIENKTKDMFVFLGDQAFRVPTKRKSEVLSKLNIV